MQAATSTSVEKALQAIVILAESPMTASELARRLGIHRSTASRLVRLLEEFRFVRRSHDGTLHLGSYLVALPHPDLQRAEVIDVARPYMQKLGHLYGHTVHLAGLETDQVGYWDKVESRQVIRMFSTIGAAAPAHATGVGKAILSHLPESELDRLIGAGALECFTEHTHRERESLMADLREIAGRGWSLDAAEHESFIHCVAAPIFGAGHRIVAAISITTPQFTVTEEDLTAMTPELIQAACNISEELGDSTQ